ncbi:receptor-like protein 2 [Malania oleifera]|uniref:receptor-like protein 2 n=1 Tax=Malania oleifera TaxID=397392 RepID=UPI0025ADF264|nr:receptor-like protein 2 [Malania oleifera]
MDNYQPLTMIRHFPCWMPFGWLMILCFSCLIPLCYTCSQVDRDSLLSFSLTISHPPTNPLIWSFSSDINDCCLWEGIACDPNGKVTHLWLPSRGLGGTISPTLKNLTRLSHLNLSHNSLTGRLPNGLFSALAVLQVLDLSFNSLHGNLSNTLPISIRTLDLSSNHFDSAIPSSFLQQAWNLVSLNISNNIFTGLIPPVCTINSSPLKILDFSFNFFSGQIPHGLISECPKLEVFNAGFNALCGLLPDDIYHAATLQEIILPSNKLSGPIGRGIVHLTNLSVLDLHDNKLSGVLPRDIGKLSKLEKLVLYINNLSGTMPASLMDCTMPASLMDCTHLRELNLGFNILQGDVSILNFSKLLRLSMLDLGDNYFTGKIPKSLYSCQSLTAVRLAYNTHMEGEIIPDILSLQSLSTLSLSTNRLTNISGAIKILMGCKNLNVLILAKNFVDEVMPDGHDHNRLVASGGFQNLRLLSQSDCGLTGQVPSWLSELMKLKVLDLSGNQLTGSIPNWLGTLPTLFYINLADNLLEGEFSQELCRLPALTSHQAMDNASFQLSVYGAHNLSEPSKAHDKQYNRPSNMPSIIDLSNNNLRGYIPAQIGQLRLLQGVSLRNNNFFGRIPDQMSNLCNLERLDLSNNHLSGKIPQSLRNLNSLAELNVSYNNLGGPIPLGTQLQSFNSSAYEGNLELCGAPLPLPCQVVSTTNDDDDQSIQQEEQGIDETLWLYVSSGIGYIMGFSAVCCTLLLNGSWRKAYFQFLTNTKDKLYVTLVVHVARMRRRHV